MNAGKINTLVTIQKNTKELDEYGEPLPATWTDVATVWGDVRHQSGLQTIKSGADVSIISASIRIRRRTDVTAGMRALVDGKVYDILAILDDVGGRVFSDLVVQLGANQG